MHFLGCEEKRGDHGTHRPGPVEEGLTLSVPGLKAKYGCDALLNPPTSCLSLQRLAKNHLQVFSTRRILLPKPGFWPSVDAPPPACPACPGKDPSNPAMRFPSGSVRALDSDKAELSGNLAGSFPGLSAEQADTGLSRKQTFGSVTVQTLRAQARSMQGTLGRPSQELRARQSSLPTAGLLSSGSQSVPRRAPALPAC